MNRTVLFFLLLCACSSPEQTSEPPVTTAPSWSENIRRYCDAASPGWLVDTISQIDRALPEPFVPDSLRYEGFNLQSPFDGEQGVRELQLRLHAMRGGEEVQLSAYGKVADGECRPNSLEVIEGYNRFDPPLRFIVSD